MNRDKTRIDSGIVLPESKFHVLFHVYLIKMNIIIIVVMQMLLSRAM